MAIVLALLSALAYGTADYVGGVVAAKASPWQVSVVVMGTAAVLAVPVALIAGGDPSTHDWLLAVSGGAVTGMGSGFLYRGLMRGRMSVVAPLSGVMAALVPAVIGIATGDRPSALAVFGIVCAVPAIALVAGAGGGAGSDAHAAGTALDGSDPTESARASILDGLLAGTGFGLLFAATGSLSEEAGLAVLPLLELSGMIGVAALAAALHEDWIPRDPAARAGWMSGALGLAAIIFVTLAGHEGMTSVVSVIAALYPAFTVLLAAVLLSERVGRLQGAGLGLAAAAVALVVLG
ncbi:MAG: EamA family transporter [Solirubrobacteraceae bacterium]|nr:EamA family transporter [Solirubrobacteraceae bacterium]